MLPTPRMRLMTDERWVANRFRCHTTAGDAQIRVMGLQMAENARVGQRGGHNAMVCEEAIIYKDYRR